MVMQQLCGKGRGLSCGGARSVPWQQRALCEQEQGQVEGPVLVQLRGEMAPGGKKAPY